MVTENDITILKPPKFDARGGKRKTVKITDRLTTNVLTTVTAQLRTRYSEGTTTSFLTSLGRLPDDVLRRVVSGLLNGVSGAFKKGEGSSWLMSLRVLLPDVADDVRTLADQHALWKNLALVDQLAACSEPEQQIVLMRVALGQAQPGEPYSEKHVVLSTTPNGGGTRRTLALRYRQRLCQSGWDRNDFSSLSRQPPATQQRLAFNVYCGRPTGLPTRGKWSARVLWPQLDPLLITEIDNKGLYNDLALCDSLVGMPVPDALTQIREGFTARRLKNTATLVSPSVPPTMPSSTTLKPGEPGYMDAICGTDAEGVELRKFINELKLALESPVPFASMDNGSKYQRWARLGYFFSQVKDGQRWFTAIRKYTADQYVNGA